MLGDGTLKRFKYLPANNDKPTLTRYRLTENFTRYPNLYLLFKKVLLYSYHILQKDRKSTKKFSLEKLDDESAFNVLGIFFSNSMRVKTQIYMVVENAERYQSV